MERNCRISSSFRKRRGKKTQLARRAAPQAELPSRRPPGRPSRLRTPPLDIDACHMPPAVSHLPWNAALPGRTMSLRGTARRERLAPRPGLHPRCTARSPFGGKAECPRTGAQAVCESGRGGPGNVGATARKWPSARLPVAPPSGRRFVPERRQTSFLRDERVRNSNHFAPASPGRGLPQTQIVFELSIRGEVRVRRAVSARQCSRVVPHCN